MSNCCKWIISGINEDADHARRYYRSLTSPNTLYNSIRTTTAKEKYGKFNGVNCFAKLRDNRLLRKFK